MKLRFFTFDNRKPIPGAIVNLRIQFESPGAPGIEAGEKAETSNAFNEAKAAVAALADMDGNGILVATTRSDAMGYGRIDLGSLSDAFRNLVMVLLAYGVMIRRAKLILEIQGSPASAVDILKMRGLHALLSRRQDVNAAPTAQSATVVAAALLELLGGADDAFYLEGDKKSASGPTGHVDDPDQKDYELSPESFVSRRPVKTGQGDGCEHLTPATLPLRQFSMHHVVVYDAATKDTGIRRSIPTVNGAPPLDNRILWGQILEFEQEWKSLGHSLGEIKYSLALAPGEAVKIAVIDWKREDTGSRLGSNASVDSLTHGQAVDRDIDDIVSGRVAEQQSGSTFMAGLAGGMDFQIPQYGISAAGRHSIGYGTSNTEGKRDVSADAHQDVHLETLQRSNLARSQNSTVIVQATQAESNFLSTRIVANMNRGHSLSILYYEVLRHLAVTTKFLRADTAILVPVDMFAFNADLARRFRAQIEPLLLDESYRAGFAALERLAADVDDTESAEPTPTAQPAPSATSNAVMASRFTIEFKTGWRWNKGAKRYNAPADTAGDIQVVARMNDGTTRTLLDTTTIFNLVFKASLEKFRTLSQLGAAIPNWSVRYENNDGWCFAKFVADVPQSINLRDVQGFAIKWRPVQLPFVPGDAIATGIHDIARSADGWNLNQASITVELSNGSVAVGQYGYASNSGELFGGRDNDEFVDQGINANLSGLPAPLPATTPSPTPTPAPATSPMPQSGLTSQQMAALLVNHLNANQYYYNSCVWLSMDPRERRQRIAGYVGGLIAGLSEPPLAMSGNHLAFRYIGKNLPAQARELLPDAMAKLAPKQSIVTLPTRGIFAEAHMGHCNAAEKRDITRLWNFDELPVSLLPNIETLTAGPRGSYQTLNPDTMGATPLGIQGTPDLPAPGEAIAKALELLAKPDIFRDQSTREQVADIMGKLIESAQPPKLTGGNIGSAFGNGKAANSDQAVSDPNEWANPFPDRSATDRYDHSVVDNDVLKAAKDHGVTDEDIAELSKKATSNSVDPQPKKPPTATVAKGKTQEIPVGLAAVTDFSSGVTRPLNGNIVLRFVPTMKNATNAGVPVTFPTLGGGGTGTNIVSLRSGMYNVLATYAIAEPSDLDFIREPFKDLFNVNLAGGLVELLYDLVQRDLASAANISATARNRIVWVPEQCEKLNFELLLEMKENQNMSFDLELGMEQGFNVATNGNVSFDSNFLKELAVAIATKLKSKEAAIAAGILSLFTVKGNIDSTNHIAGSGSEKVKLTFKPAYLANFVLNEVK